MNNLSLKALVKTYKFKSIFVKMTLAMISLSIISCSLFFLFVANSVIHSSQEQRIETSMAHLNTIVHNADYMLVENLHHSLIQFSLSRNALAFSYLQSYDSHKTNMAMVDLAISSSYNSLIQKAFLYAPSIDCVVTSEYQEYALSDFPFRDIISSYMSEEKRDSFLYLENEGKTSVLFPWNGTYIIALDLPLMGSRRLATIYYMLDMQKFCSNLTVPASEESGIWVYGPDHTPVFSHLVSYPSLINEDVFDALDESGCASVTLGNKRILCSSSVISGWSFLYVLNEYALTPSFREVLQSFLPFLLIILCVTALIAFAFTLYLYRPLQKLISLIDSQHLPASPEQGLTNELEYLNNAFSEVSRSQKKLQSIVSSVSNDIISRFFLQLLSGRQFSYEEADKILKNSQSRFKANAIYVACAFRCQESQLSSARILDQFIEEFKKLLTDFNERCGAVTHLVMPEKTIFAVVASFHIDCSIIQAKKQLTALKNSAALLFDRYRIDADFGMGYFYHSILDIGFSYIKISYSPLRQALPSSDGKAPPAETVEQPEPIAREAGDFETQARHIVTCVLNGDASGAEKLLKRELSQLSSRYNKNTELASRYESFLTCLVNAIADLDYVASPVLNIDQMDQFRQKTQDVSESEALLAAASDICFDIIHSLDLSYQKSQHHLILAAREYIDKHYSDPSISLNSIAEALNVTPNYLGKLFINNLGVYFTNYVNQIRIDHSLELLNTTKKSVAEISAQVGFSTVQNYIRVFKKSTGKTPGKYRSGEQ